MAPEKLGDLSKDIDVQAAEPLLPDIHPKAIAPQMPSLRILKLRL